MMGRIALFTGVLAFCLLGSAAAEEGLVGHWSFDKIADGTVKDLSGTGNDGKVIGKLQPVQCGKGCALEFDGSRKMISVPDNDTLDLTTTGTVEAWVLVKAYLDKPQYPAIVQKGKKVGWVAGSYHLFYHTLNRIFYGAVNSGQQNDYVQLGKPPEGEWQYLAFTWDGRDMRGYVNGKLVQTKPQTITAPVNDEALWIGRSLYGSIKGYVDEVKVYNRARTEQEIAATYDQMKAGMVKPLAEGAE